MLTFAFLLALAAQAEVAPMWITFDVLNPEAAERHRILHLDELLASKARAIFLFTTVLDECSKEVGVCAEVGKIARDPAAKDGIVIGVLLDPQENVPRARKEVPAAHHPFVVAADPHGITRHALQVDRPGEIIVINSRGSFVRFSQPSENLDELRRKIEDAKRAFLQSLRRDKEDEG